MAALRRAGIATGAIETLLQNEVDEMEALHHMEKSDLLHLGLKMGTVVKLIKLAGVTSSKPLVSGM